MGAGLRASPVCCCCQAARLLLHRRLPAAASHAAVCWCLPGCIGCSRHSMVLSGPVVKCAAALYFASRVCRAVPAPWLRRRLAVHVRLACGQALASVAAHGCQGLSGSQSVAEHEGDVSLATATSFESFMRQGLAILQAEQKSWNRGAGTHHLVLSGRIQRGSSRHGNDCPRNRTGKQPRTTAMWAA